MNASTERFVLPGPTGDYDLVQAVRLSADDVDKTLREASAVRVAGPDLRGSPPPGRSRRTAGRVPPSNSLTRWTVAGSWPHATPPGQPRQPINCPPPWWTQPATNGHKSTPTATCPSPSEVPAIPTCRWRACLYRPTFRRATTRCAWQLRRCGRHRSRHSGDAPSAADAAVATVSVVSPVIGELPFPRTRCNRPWEATGCGCSANGNR